MIRLIVNIADAGMAANVGGPVHQSFKTFDIEHTELEQLLTQTKNTYQHSFLSGCEVIEGKAKAEEVQE